MIILYIAGTVYLIWLGVMLVQFMIAMDKDPTFGGWW